MTDDKAGPVRVEEPQGYDRTPTERIPVAGDSSAGRGRPVPAPDTTEDTVDGRHELPNQEPAAGVETPGPRTKKNADGDDSLAGRRAEPELTTDRPGSPTDGSGVAGDRRDLPEDGVTGATDRHHPDTAERAVEELPPEPPADRGTPTATEPSTSAALFEESSVNRFRDQWRELQADFVDDPARAVRGADELVDQIMRELAERKQSLEGRWRDGTQDTERLRVAIKEYRSLFNQLLNA